MHWLFCRYCWTWTICCSDTNKIIQSCFFDNIKTWFVFCVNFNFKLLTSKDLFLICMYMSFKIANIKSIKICYVNLLCVTTIDETFAVQLIETSHWSKNHITDMKIYEIFANASQRFLFVLLLLVVCKYYFCYL